MKRFLRYLAYRELTRQLRQLFRDAGEDDHDDRTPQTTREDLAELGLEEGQRLDDPAALRRALQAMDPYDFEWFVADLWELLGWETTVSEATADEGVDVVATKSVPYEQKTLIQAKRYGRSTTVSSPDVQQYASLEHQYPGVDKVVIVTTNEFTAPAREMAERLNVKLIDGDDLVELVIETESGDLVAEYLPFATVADSRAKGETGDADERTDAKTGDSDERIDAETERSDEESVDGAEHRQEEQSDVDVERRTDERSAAEVGDRLPSTRWHKIVVAATVGWIALIAGVEVLPSTVFGAVFLFSWLGLPLAIYQDAQTIAANADWPGYTWAYVLGSFVWFVSIPVAVVYLWRRRAAVNAGSD
ncbi:MAG: restriction endonuclease [Natronomonas sp.]